MSDAAQAVIVRGGLSVVLVGLGILDLRTGRVPNAVVMPLLLATVPLNVFRLGERELAAGQGEIIVLAWATCLALWSLRVFGGGDVKLAMALMGLFPNWRMVWTLLTAVLAGLIVVLIVQQRRAGLRRLGAVAAAAARGALPGRAETIAALRARGNRITVVISLAGTAYLLLPNC